MAGAVETVRSLISCQTLPSELIQCSGPSKGYNESLELRLRETESVFLSLLAIVSDEHLSSLSAFEIPEGDVTPSAADKKQKLEEWANFPLRSREDVMTWRDERLSKDARYQSPTDVKSGLEMQMDVGDNVRMDNGGVTTGGKGGAEVDMEGMDKPLDNMGGVGIQGIGSLNPMDHIQATEFEHYLPPVETGHSSISAAELPSTLPGRGMLGLSKEFQDTFLW